jgi:hypothetical protein
MHITRIVVFAGRTFNHPHEDYSNLKPSVVKQLGTQVFYHPLGTEGRVLGSRLKLRDAKRGDPSEWPNDLRDVREFPNFGRDGRAAPSVPQAKP